MITSFRLSKMLITGLLIASMAAVCMFGAFTPKAQASVSWGQEVTEVGKLYLKAPYKWGGKTPKGFDASGFTQYVFKKSAAKMSLPSSSKDQYKLGKAVKQKDLKEGDLVFYKTNGKDISFVGIYLSKGQFLAVTVSKGVSVQSMSSKYWKDKYAGAKRVLPKY